MVRRVFFLFALATLGCGGALEPDVAAGDASVDSDATGTALDATSASDGAPDASRTDAADDGAPPDPTAASFLINPAHTNAVIDPTLAPPLAPLWSRNFGIPFIVNAPVPAAGMVYTFLKSGGAADSELVALDKSTGATIWGPISFPGVQNTVPAFDGGRVFVATSPSPSACAVDAYDAATGQLIWAKSLAIGCTDGSTAVAYRGIVYVPGDSLFALDEATGAVLWSATGNGPFDFCPPAVTDDGVYILGGYTGSFAFDRLTGTRLWSRPNGGGDGTPVVAGGLEYIVDPIDGNVIVDVTNGNTVGPFTSAVTPAIDGNIAVYNSRSAPIQAVNTATGKTMWTFAGDGKLNLTPVIAAGTVYIGSDLGMIFGIDEQTGQQVWSMLTTPPLTPSLVAGQGLLLVTNDGASTLVAYGRAQDGGVADGGVMDGGVADSGVADAGQ